MNDDLPIRHMLRRLAAAGFPEDWVRRALLPDWWDDELSRDPSSLAMAEIAIARWTRVSIADLRDAHCRLRPRVEGWESCVG